jgi:hypothetical protein
VRAGWRQVRLARKPRRYDPAPAGTFVKLAHAAARERDALYRTMLGPMTK